MTTSKTWRHKFDREFGFDSEYMKTLPASLPTEDVGLLIGEISRFIETTIAEERIEESALWRLAITHQTEEQREKVLATYLELKKEFASKN